MGCGKSKHAIATENTLVKSKSKGKSVETNNNTITIDGNVQETGENKILKENEIHADVIDKDEGRVEPLPEEKPKEAEKIADGNMIKKIDENNEEKFEAVASVVAAVDESKNEVLINGEKKDDVGVDHEVKENTVSHDFPVMDESALEANSDKEKEEAIEVDECKEVVAPASVETESSAEEKVLASVETESSVEEKVPASDETESSVEEKVPASKETESSVEEKAPAAKDENVDADSTTAVKAN
ncbi:hypothetical protein ABFS82_07G018800 [Erythranthe guttata]